VAATWLLPIGKSSANGSAYGTDTTKYGEPPSSAGWGYAFSGGASAASQAAVEGCGKGPVDFVLPVGGNVAIQILNASGQVDTNQNPPPDNLSLPGLGTSGALLTAPTGSDGLQHIDRLATGVLTIDGTATSLSCRGPGVTADLGSAGADVTVTQGSTVTVICTEAS
jgi:hypothetical protein